MGLKAVQLGSKSAQFDLLNFYGITVAAEEKWWKRTQRHVHGFTSSTLFRSKINCFEQHFLLCEFLPSFLPTGFPSYITKLRTTNLSTDLQSNANCKNFVKNAVKFLKIASKLLSQILPKKAVNSLKSLTVKCTSLLRTLHFILKST